MVATRAVIWLTLLLASTAIGEPSFPPLWMQLAEMRDEGTRLSPAFLQQLDAVYGFCSSANCEVSRPLPALAPVDVTRD